MQLTINDSHSLSMTHRQMSSADGTLRVCGCEHNYHKNAGQDGLHAPGLALDHAVGSIDVVGSSKSSIKA